MESWSVELALGFSVNVAVVAFCWVSGWRPVDTSSSVRWHDAQRDEEQTIDDDEHESAVLWSGGVETTVGLVIAVAVMVAVAVEITSETSARVTADSRY
ncbi:uncharacterized protein IUM83_02232 [Phytophthora cinnamomi]|uniref:uncharacterized protein n=1 Tax=Phytophthora cinnamomi TaxID=4785 RepID=UPI002A25BBA6|nr:hypothetical protein IUM83_02232 [Phytophthora cinnamomi]KAJ8575048.1 hypothetical protein ON010_g4163 [Phytophthora cinnamomi]